MRLIAVAVPLLSLACCRRPAPPAEELPLVPRVDPSALVVARVNGVPILDADLREQLRASRAGATAEDRGKALHALVQAELLAQEAARRGLTRHPAVRDVQRRALAEAFVRRRFQFAPKDIPREHVERAYNLNKLRYQRPEAVNVTHIVVVANARNTPDFHRRALRMARRIHSIAVSGRLPEKSFREIADLVAKDAPAMTIKAESLTTPLRGVTAAEFADAAFALREPGQISPVVQSPFGYHVIYLNERLPPRNVSLAQADEEIRGMIFEEVRQQMFFKWLEKLERQHAITTNPDVVARIATP
jgi:peptidyl-prolyl cis-trans isomerase C